MRRLCLVALVWFVGFFLFVDCFLGGSGGGHYYY